MQLPVYLPVSMDDINKFLPCSRVSHYLLESGGDGQMTPLLRLGCGACAGIIGMSATYPLDMVRGRLTVQNNKEYTGIMHATRQIIKQVCTVNNNCIVFT